MTIIVIFLLAIAMLYMADKAMLEAKPSLGIKEREIACPLCDTSYKVNYKVHEGNMFWQHSCEKNGFKYSITLRKGDK